MIDPQTTFVPLGMAGRPTTAEAVAAIYGVEAGSMRNSASTPDLESLSYDELVERLNGLKDLSNKIQSDAVKDGRDQLTEREEKRVETIFAQFEEIDAELKSRPEAHQTRAQAQSDRTRSGAAMSAGRKTAPDHLGKEKPAADAPRAGIIFARSERDFSARLFDRSEDAWKGDSADFFNAVATRTYDPRFRTARNAFTGTEGVGADGGFDVPTIWYRGVVDQALQQSEYAQRCRVFPAETNSLTIPLLDTRNQANGVAGLIANWAAENETQITQALKWRAESLKLNKTFILSEASSELVEDGISYETQLTGAMSLATAQTLDAGILYGTGVGMPLGIIKSTSALMIAKETGQAASTVLWENLVAMWARLTAASRKNATWFVSSSLLPSLMAVKVPSTSAPALLSGSFNDAGAGAPAMSIFGRPVVFTDINPVAGAPGDIILADLTQYALLMKKSARLETDAGPGFARDVQSFRMIMRVGGQPMWDSPITPFNGGQTLSWATYLAAR